MQPVVTLFRIGKIWHYRFRVDGKRTQRSTREVDQTQADQLAQDALHAAKCRARGEEPEPILRVLAAQWEQAHALVLSASRIKSVATFVRMHFESLRDLPLRELTTARIETARDAYLADHARSSANLWLNCLSTLIHWAIRRKMIRQVPWQVAELKVQQKPKVLLPTAKSEPWMAKVDELGAAEPGILLVIRLMIGLGLRISEALDARWEWLDLERMTYTPGKTKGFEAWSRAVPPWLLDQLLPSARIIGNIVPVRPGHPITDARVAYLMRRANQECGVLHVTPHRLRGTYATWLSEMGVPIQDIQRALGHKDIRTTIRYLESDLNRVVNAQVLIGRRLGMAGREIGAPRPAGSDQPELSGFPVGIRK